MRDLLVPAGLALIVHGLLFMVSPEWMKKKALDAGVREPLTVSMVYKKAPTQKPPQPKLVLNPEQETRPLEKKQPQKVEIRKDSEKKNPPKKPPKKPKAKPKTQSASRKIVQHPPAPQPAPLRKPAPAPPSELTPTPPPVTSSFPKQQSQAAPESWQESTSLPTSVGRAETTARPNGEEKAPEPAKLPLTEAIPDYKTNPPPVYPRMARRRGYEGTVLMEVLVNREGRVETLRLLESSGHHVLDREAMAAVKTWLFEPGRMGKEKVDMWVKVPIRFKLR